MTKVTVELHSEATIKIDEGHVNLAVSLDGVEISRQLEGPTIVDVIRSDRDGIRSVNLVNADGLVEILDSKVVA